MSISDLFGNENAKKIISNELLRKKDCGTYLLHGVKGVNLLEYAKGFAKSLNCTEILNDYCGNCRVCNNIDKEVYSDLIYMDAKESGARIDDIREVIAKTGESSYESLYKIFIIDNINYLRKEASNALLKVIEEPPVGNFFFLLSNSLNILPTILSRSIMIKIEPLSYKELGVDKDIYDFYFGDIADINSYINENIEINKINYENINEMIHYYQKEPSIINKTNMLSSLKNLNDNIDFLDELDKIFVANEIYLACEKNRALIIDIMYYLIKNSSNIKAYENLLKIKESISFNVNTSIALTNFILNL